MLRTNSKQTREKVRALINELFDASSYGREDLNNASIEEKIKFIASACWKELGHEVKKNRASFCDMFILWCQGLPSVLDTAYYYLISSAKDLLGDLLEETGSERNRFTEPEAERMISYLIYKERANDLYKIAY